MEAKNIDHDGIFKVLIKEFFQEFIELFIPDIAQYGELESFDFNFKDSETINNIFSEVAVDRKRVSDVVAKVKFKQGESYFIVHIESESTAYRKVPLNERMFLYCARLYELLRIPIRPIALLTFDTPKTDQPNSFGFGFPDLEVLDFNYTTIQLNKFSWRDYLNTSSSLAAALMAKMGVKPEEMPQVKIECLRLIGGFKYNVERKSYILSSFVDTYLRLNDEQEQEFEKLVQELDLEEKAKVIELTTSWERKGFEKGKEEGIEEGREEGIQQGEIAQARDFLQKYLATKFSVDAVDEFMEVINQIEDKEVLNTLFDSVIITDSEQAFREVLQAHLPSESDAVE